jgi:chemotaxis protein MotB
MAKTFEPSGETVVKGKGGPLRPEKPARGFPFRLLLWALLMTGAAGAGGYFAWKFREDALGRKGALDQCQQSLAPTKHEADTAKASLQTCQTEVAGLQTQRKEIDAQLEQVSKNLNGTTEELTALRAQRAEQEKRIAAIEQIQNQFAKMIDTGELKVTSRRGSLVVELPSEVLFPSASAELSRKGEVAVLQVGGILKQFGDRRFLVVGHTDNQPLKGSKYEDNWELSVARALKVTRYLVEGGMKQENLTAAGVGDSDPIADNKSSEGRARNRRIEIALMPALNELPPLPKSLEEAGKQAEEAAKKADGDKKPDKKDDKKDK